MYWLSIFIDTDRSGDWRLKQAPDLDSEGPKTPGYKFSAPKSDCLRKSIINVLIIDFLSILIDGVIGGKNGHRIRIQKAWKPPSTHFQRRNRTFQKNR